MKKNMVIAQSGGPSAVINASLAGAVKRALESDEIGEIYGSLYGLEGILKSETVNLRDEFRDPSDIEKLRNTPAMALGSCRYKLDMENEDETEKILAWVKDNNIGYFFYIGGNDSMDTVHKLSDYFALKLPGVKVIGIPKTIDNDLMNTDHTPGFSSAARYIATSVKEIYTDTLSYDKPTVTFVEIMGRNAGWLAASSVMARGEDCSAPHLVYLPEVPFDEDEFRQELKEMVDREKITVVAVSEGLRNREGKYVSSSESQSHDKFGHAMLKGAGTYLEEIAKDMGYKTRTVELSLLQRSAGHCVSQTDREEAFICGEKAVEAALNGETGVMIAMERIPGDEYRIEYKSEIISGISNREKMIPEEWIEGRNVTSQFTDYMKPLIGEEPLPYHYRISGKMKR